VSNTLIGASWIVGAVLAAFLVYRNTRNNRERRKVKLELSINRLVKKAEVEWDTYGDAINLYGRRAIRVHPAHILIPKELLKNRYDEIKFVWEGGTTHIYTDVEVGKMLEPREDGDVYECNVRTCSSKYYNTELKV
jgi:hypothetical protein